MLTRLALDILCIYMVNTMCELMNMLPAQHASWDACISASRHRSSHRHRLWPLGGAATPARMQEAATECSRSSRCFTHVTQGSTATLQEPWPTPQSMI